MKIDILSKAKSNIEQGGDWFDFNVKYPDPPAPAFDFNDAPPQSDPAATVTAETCRARCRKSGLCYARAAFDAKMGKGVECVPWGCEYLAIQNGG